jgi:hypothetical protein
VKRPPTSDPRPGASLGDSLYRPLLLDIETCLLPWEYCAACHAPLMFHWRGRPCLQPEEKL